MDPFEIKINDFQKFGERLKRWSKGELSIPETVGAFRADVPPSEATLAPEFLDADAITIFKAPDKTKLSILIPNANDLQEDPPSPYRLPDFYDEAYGETLVIPKAEEENFRSKRIADYSMRKCV